MKVGLAHRFLSCKNSVEASVSECHMTNQQEKNEINTSKWELELLFIRSYLWCVRRRFPSWAGCNRSRLSGDSEVRSNTYVPDVRGESNGILPTALPSGSETLDSNVSKHMAEFTSALWDVPHTNTRPSWFIHEPRFPFNLRGVRTRAEKSFYLPRRKVTLKIMNSFLRHRRVC